MLEADAATNKLKCLPEGATTAALRTLVMKEPCLLASPRDRECQTCTEVIFKSISAKTGHSVV